jgi:serine/threonine protein kinase
MASPLSLPSGDTRIAVTIAGIVLGMQYLYSRRFIHRELKPESIQPDWNWIFHIWDFNYTVSLDHLPQPPSEESGKSNSSQSLTVCHAAPEAHHNVYTSKSTVFFICIDFVRDTRDKISLFEGSHTT